MRTIAKIVLTYVTIVVFTLAITVGTSALFGTPIDYMDLLKALLIFTTSLIGLCVLGFLVIVFIVIMFNIWN